MDGTDWKGIYALKRNFGNNLSRATEVLAYFGTKRLMIG